MKNEKIAHVLKEYRKRNHYTVQDVAIMLEDHSVNVATKTIYGWESGQAQPDADTLMLLCEIYNIENVLGTFGYTDDPDFHVTMFEKKLIESYRKHPEMQDAVNRLLNV